jgi:hypothetical protein
MPLAPFRVKLYGENASWNSREVPIWLSIRLLMTLRVKLYGENASWNSREVPFGSS